MNMMPHHLLQWNRRETTWSNCKHHSIVLFAQSMFRRYTFSYLSIYLTRCDTFLMSGNNSMSAMYLKSAFFLPINEHIYHLGFHGKILTSLCFVLAALFAITQLRTTASSTKCTLLRLIFTDSQ
jgi:hypothetical protein